MRTKLPLTVIAIVLSIAASLPAQAQRARVFVSVTGVDSGQCPATAPCRTFQFAHDAVLPGGEISVLNTGGYGPLTITKAISIVSPLGVEASIATPSGGTAITVNAGSTDKVSLRGLTLDGTGVAADGIDFNSGLALTIEDCVVRNMTAFGLQFRSFATSPQTLAVSNSYFTDNGDHGILIETLSSGTITASIDRTGFYGNGQVGLVVAGVSGTGPLDVTVRDSVASNNNFYGFDVASNTGQSVTNLSLTHSLAEGNGTSGVFAFQPNATLWLAQSTLTGNGAGYQAFNGGTINSYGDNYLGANKGAPAGTLGSVPKL